jgi:prepilin-type processing-associated H-X9-DG protein
LEEGDDPDYDWGNVANATGVCYKHSEVRLGDIVDGTGHTYLLGEKRCNTRYDDRGDDQHMYVGHGFDVARYTSLDLPPMKDGPEEGNRRFGSAHPGGCYFAFADGSVVMISYQIDPEIHRRLGNRRDRGVVLE